MTRAAQNDKMQERVTQQGINMAVSQATQGQVTALPPEVSKAATDFIRQNPDQVMELMRLATQLRK